MNPQSDSYDDAFVGISPDATSREAIRRLGDVRKREMAEVDERFGEALVRLMSSVPFSVKQMREAFTAGVTEQEQHPYLARGIAQNPLFLVVMVDDTEDGRIMRKRIAKQMLERLVERLLGIDPDLARNQVMADFLMAFRPGSYRITAEPYFFILEKIAPPPGANPAIAKDYLRDAQSTLGEPATVLEYLYGTDFGLEDAARLLGLYRGLDLPPAAPDWRDNPWSQMFP
jgi:hypothetical protein